jgi:uncharacterized protein (TIGR03000 family)
MGSVYGTYGYPGYGTPVYGVPVDKTGTKFDSGAKTDDKKDMDKKDMDKKDPDKKDPDKKNVGANLKFVLPANAKLYVDGRLTGGDGAERTFYTPPLAPGQQFYYEVRAEVMVNGEMVTEEKRVIVSSGANVVETFPKLTAAVEKANALAGK